MSARFRSGIRMVHLAIALVAAVAACRDVGAPSTTSAVVDPAMTATVNGNAWSANRQMSPLAYLADYGTAMWIIGLNEAGYPGQEIDIALRWHGVGTYAIGNARNAQSYSSYVYYPAPGSSSSAHYETLSATSGTVTITKFDSVSNEITGSFSFTASGPFVVGPPPLPETSIAVQNGRFDGQFVVCGPGPATATCVPPSGGVVGIDSAQYRIAGPGLQRPVW